MRLLLIGGGKMGTAMLAGWKNATINIIADVLTPHPSDALNGLCANVFTDIAQVNTRYDVIVLAVKPQIVMGLLGDLTKLISSETVFISIITGKTLQTLQDGLQKPAAIVRAMPNTPALIGQGMTACIANDNVSKAQKEIVTELLSAVGELIWLTDEDQMHAVTALSGSGPAYIFAMIEAMQKAGEANGLSADLALMLALKTMQGAGQLAMQSDKPPAELRQQVTSPNGTTAAALGVLQGDNALDKLVTAAITAADRRSRELA